MKLIKSILVDLINLVILGAAGYGLYIYGSDLDPTSKGFTKDLITTIAVAALLILVLVEAIIFIVKAHRTHNYKARHLVFSLILSVVIIGACTFILFYSGAYEHLEKFYNNILLFPIALSLIKILLVCLVYRDGKTLHIVAKKQPVIMKSAAVVVAAPSAPVVKKATTASKVVVKKQVAKKPASKKPAAKKPTAKKAPVKKAATKKAPTKKKPAPKKAPAKKKGKKK
ncbi:MAG: hypothetical protein MJ207_03100 [Bacilli bacterium]|nr:hypothetical protein [Bacilli bacterium]